MFNNWIEDLGNIIWQDHVEHEHLSLKSVWNIVSTTSWVIHGSDELDLFDTLETSDVGSI